MKKLLFFTSLMFLSMWFACSPVEENKQNNKSDTVPNELTKNEEYQNAEKFLYSLPSPHETAHLLINKCGVEFSKEILNPLDNVTKYNTDISKAINFGIYSVDLSYAGLYKENQITINYIGITQKLSEELGIVDLINDEMIQRIKDNIDNKTALLNIFSELFTTTDTYFRASKRNEFTAIIVYAGWIEGLYIASQLAAKDNKAILTERIARQKLIIEIMEKMFNSYTSSKYIAKLKPDLEKLSGAFKKFEDTQNVASEDFENFVTILTEIRNKYTKK